MKIKRKQLRRLINQVINETRIRVPNPPDYLDPDMKDTYDELVKSAEEGPKDDLRKNLDYAMDLAIMAQEPPEGVEPFEGDAEDYRRAEKDFQDADYYGKLRAKWGDMEGLDIWPYIDKKEMDDLERVDGEELIFGFDENEEWGFWMKSIYKYHSQVYEAVSPQTLTSIVCKGVLKKKNPTKQECDSIPYDVFNDAYHKVVMKIIELAMPAYIADYHYYDHEKGDFNEECPLNDPKYKSNYDDLIDNDFIQIADEW